MNYFTPELVLLSRSMTDWDEAVVGKWQEARAAYKQRFIEAQGRIGRKSGGYPNLHDAQILRNCVFRNSPVFLLEVELSAPNCEPGMVLALRYDIPEKQHGIRMKPLPQLEDGRPTTVLYDELDFDAGGRLVHRLLLNGAEVSIWCDHIDWYVVKESFDSIPDFREASQVSWVPGGIQVAQAV